VAWPLFPPARRTIQELKTIKRYLNGRK
jgi:hypothetical protein